MPLGESSVVSFLTELIFDIFPRLLEDRRGCFRAAKLRRHLNVINFAHMKSCACSTVPQASYVKRGYIKKRNCHTVSLILCVVFANAVEV